MRESASDLGQHVSLAPSSLLVNDEVIVVVDDEQMIREPVKIFLEKQGLAVMEAGSASEFWQLMDSHDIALVLLDIGLPDRDGVSLLPEIQNKSPDLAIVMLTGVDDLQVALECMRKGADDFLTKPAQFQEIYFTVRKVLEKRRLLLENRKYQTDLENAQFRIQLLHQLTLKMNTAYLSTTELDEILQAILVGITASEGLGFNRAFLVMFDKTEEHLKGCMAIGASSREEAGQIWAEMNAQQLSFLDIVKKLKLNCQNGDTEVNNICSAINIPITDQEHILVKAVVERKSVNVVDGKADVPVSKDLINILGENSFVIIPLYSPGRALGAIVADNFVTRKPINKNLITTLELFASQASLAIEHSHLYADMQNKIGELQDLNYELDKSKDLLVEAERFSALGQMAAQLVHAIRNPITTIGGAARMLSKKIDDDEWLKFIKMMVKETGRVESTLEDLFDFVKQTEFQKESAALYPLIKKTIILLQQSMEKQGVSCKLDLPEPEPYFEMDTKQIRQMLLHLMKNAVEAMPDGGNLAIKYKEENGWGNISITDSGIGMGEENITRAHDPFFTTKTYGTGLGLTMVERIVQAHGGKFNLHTRDGNGMEATVMLPFHV